MLLVQVQSRELYKWSGSMIGYAKDCKSFLYRFKSDSDFQILHIMKYKYYFKKKNNKSAQCYNIKSGNFFLIAQNNGIIKLSQIECIRNILRKKLKKQFLFNINLYPDRFSTKKASNARMGKGKGNINNNICQVRAGMVLVSLNTTDSKFSHSTLKSIQTHLGVKSTIYTKLGCLVLFFNIGIFGYL